MAQIHKITYSGDIVWSEGIAASTGEVVYIEGETGITPMPARFSIPAPTIEGTSTLAEVVHPPAMTAKYAMIAPEVEGSERIIPTQPMVAKFDMVSPSVEYTVNAEPMVARHSLTAESAALGNIINAEPIPTQFGFANIGVDYTGSVELIAQPITAKHSLDASLVYKSIPVDTPIIGDLIYAQPMAAKFSMISPAAIEYDGGVTLSPQPMAAKFSFFGAVVTIGEPDPEPAAAVDWDVSAIYYRCTLTGAANGVADIILPISSFQVRMRSGRPSYMGVVVPNAPMHIDAVMARPNGEIIIEQGRRYSDGIDYDELFRVNYESMGHNQGARNSSINLSGYKTISSVPKIVDLRGVSIVAMQKTGVRRVTAAVDFRVRAGDTVEWGNESMITGMVAIAVGRNHATMTITEV